jgi:predicted unusual protein kinase regulating ubiquinone biosynthesis (AarF/ABC1/UbiB family)/DNA-binding XRE family transcriptional regulator
MPSATLATNDGVRLRAVRETLGLTQRDFAKDLGVAPSALAQWESGSRLLPRPIGRLLALYEEQLRLGPGAADEPRQTKKGPSWLTRTASTVYAGALWTILRRVEERSGTTSFERKIRDAAIDKYAQTLGELRGLGLKYGQMLANADAIDPLRSPDDALSASALQAKPMAHEAVLELFLGETGKTPRMLFAEWAQSPLFAASFGQVHRATLRSGENVAVKVQYPDAVETLRADLRNVELLDRLFCVIAPAQRPRTFFDELSARFLEECDYTIEAENIRLFRRHFEGRRDVRIPRVIDALSSRRILTVEYVDGQSLDEFARGATQAARNRAGTTIWDFFYGPATRGFFHADPHAGNLLFGEDAVTFLDFGRVGRISKPFSELWIELARAILERDRSRAISLLARMDFTGAPEMVGEDLYRFAVATQVPWLGEGPFAFTTEFAHLVWKVARAEGLRRHLSVPRDAVLWHQLIFGVYALLVPLQCRVDIRDSTLARLYQPGEKRPPPYTRAELASLGF